MDLLCSRRCVWLSIIALEQAALLGIIGAATLAKANGSRPALRFAAANSRSVVMVAARLVVCTLLAMAPFLLLAGLIYRQLLTKFDINYYLKEWPGEFQLAVVLGTVIVAVLSRGAAMAGGKLVLCVATGVVRGRRPFQCAASQPRKNNRASSQAAAMDRQLGSGNGHRVDADDRFDSLSWAIVCAPCDRFVVASDGRGWEHARFVGRSRSGRKSAEHDRLCCDAVPSLSEIR